MLLSILYSGVESRKTPFSRHGTQHLPKCFFEKLCYVIAKQFYVAGWSSLAARVAHNHEVVGSNPTPATKILKT